MPAASRTTLSQALEALEEEFSLDTQALNDLSKHFIKAMHYGLSNQGADMAMIPSFVTGVPDGTEKGTYLALDLGGTNLRVCQVGLKGDGTFDMKQEKYKVSDALKQGPVTNLMDYIAGSVDTFLTDFGSDLGEHLTMGFTFSFPCDQTAIDKGFLIKWTKGFSCPDAPGKDVIQLLQNALDRKHIKVKVNALVNDTVGALLAHSYQSGGSFIGAIYGTGTNGAYVARSSDVKKLSSDGKSKYMLVNTEWGGFDDNAQARTGSGLRITRFDNAVDRTAIVPRLHCFEKMISGMYLGELARVIMIELIDSLLLFSGYSSKQLNTMYAFDTAYVSAVLSQEGLEATRKVLVSEMGVDPSHISDEDLKTVQKICQIVASRAARLSSVPVASTITHIGPAEAAESQSTSKKQEKINVGVDGSVVEFLPGFQAEMKRALEEILGKETADKIQFGLAKDGSGVGAALCSLQAVKQSQS
ncbi:unnamed protein product [Sympodiomycopsis kandeliae]